MEYYVSVIFVERSQDLYEMEHLFLVFHRIPVH